MDTDARSDSSPSAPQSTALQFLRYARDHPELLTGSAEAFRAGIFEIVGNISNLPRDLEEPLQRWPTWIEPGQLEIFERVSVGLARIFRSVPERLFGGDSKKIAEFLGMPDDLMASILLAEPNFLEETLCRGDFIDTEQGLKLIEFNLGNLGGWRHSAFEPLYLAQPAVAGFLADSGLSIRSRDSIRALFRHILRHTLKTPLGAGPEINVLIVASDAGLTSVASHPTEAYAAAFQEVFPRVAPGKGGTLEVVRISDLEFPRSEVHVAGRRFHVVIEQNDTRPSREIFRSFKAGLVNCYTSPLGMILGDKKLLALLSSEASSDHFDREERQLLENHLPWTRKITGEPLRFRGDEGPAVEVLRRHQKSLVLKAGSSYGGADVHIGPATETSRWAGVAADAVAGNGWVAQEYLEPKPQIYPGASDTPEAREFDLAWGLYVFGDEYAGAFLRMAPKGEMPVLNVARGARVGLAFEVLRSS